MPAVRMPRSIAGLTCGLAVLAIGAATLLSQAADDLPLKPTRAFSLDTDEGTWISVDVSPDGETIVFDLLGDLYTLPFAGGDASPLTSGLAWDGQPRYSPDGERVVFVSDRDGAENLWLIDVATGQTRQVTNADANSYESPDWLPDGDYVIAATASHAAARGDARNPKLWMWHVDGGTGVQLIREPGSRRIAGPAAEPDGRRIWYAQRTRLWQYNAVFPQYQLAYYDRETGEQYTRSARYGSAFRPTISPDGEWLVYGTRYEDATGLRLRHLATGDERWLAYPVTRDDQESVASSDVLPGMSFTPDSSELVVSYGGGIWRVPIARGAEPIPVPFRVRTELDLGPELAFRYDVDDSPTFLARQIRDAVPAPGGVPAGVRRVRPALGPSAAGWRGSPPHRPRRGRSAAGLVARRRIDCVRHLVVRRRPHPSSACRRQRAGGAVDDRSRHLPAPGVVGRRRASGRHPGTRSRLPRVIPFVRGRSEREHHCAARGRGRLDAGRAGRRPEDSAHRAVRSGSHLSPPRR